MGAPDLTAKVLGYREWQVANGQLVSVGIGRIFWVPGRNEARCLAGGGHLAPHADCVCGLYARHQVLQEWFVRPIDTLTIGAVLGWGKMSVHRSGWRAQYAEVALLAYDELKGREHVERTKTVAAYYGCPAVRIEGFEAAAQELGRGIPHALYPEEAEAPELEFYLPIAPSRLNVPATTEQLARLELELKQAKRRWWRL